MCNEMSEHIRPVRTVTENNVAITLFETLACNIIIEKDTHRFFCRRGKIFAEKVSLLAGGIKIINQRK